MSKSTYIFLIRQTFLTYGTVLSSSRGIILWLSDFEAQINPTEGLSSPDRTAPIPSTLPGRLSQLDCMSNLHIIWTTQLLSCLFSYESTLIF